MVGGRLKQSSDSEFEKEVYVAFFLSNLLTTERTTENLSLTKEHLEEAKQLEKARSQLLERSKTLKDKLKISDSLSDQMEIE